MPVLTPLERVGTLVGARYELNGIVGQGASAVLFAGRDRVLGRDVAIKVMRPDGTHSGTLQRERFAAEGQLLARLRHPNLVDVYDVGESDDGVPFVVVELLSGETLAERLDRVGSLTVQDTLAILLPIIGALASAHDVGVIHRDVKPANIFLHQPSPGTCIPKLLDFGIARAPDATGMTSSGIALGTPAYMAPEQACGESLTAAADVWAMGVTLYRCLVGRLPFEAATAAGVTLEAMRHGAPRMDNSLPSLDRGIGVAIERALEPRLTRRYADMRVLSEALVRTGCRAGIRLPAIPDPIGLPTYEHWLIEARAEEHTAAQAISSRVAVDSRRRIITRRPGRTRAISGVPAVDSGEPIGTRRPAPVAVVVLAAAALVFVAWLATPKRAAIPGEDTVRDRAIPGWELSHPPAPVSEPAAHVPSSMGIPTGAPTAELPHDASTVDARRALRTEPARAPARANR